MIITQAIKIGIGQGNSEQKRSSVLQGLLHDMSNPVHINTLTDEQFRSMERDMEENHRTPVMTGDNI